MSIIQWMNESLERKYFTEDLASDRKKYTELVGADKRLTLDEFDRCCKADPTYKEGSNKSGSYLSWIIKRYTDFRKNNPNKEFDFISCTDDLKSFNEIVTHKLFLKGDDEKHDINYFTSLEALDDFVKGKGTHKEGSGRQQQRNQNATTITVDHADPDLVFENDRCKVWVPYTYETSRQLGGDTRWCTAASTRGNWDSYSKEGPLFIMIMKKNPKEKYQFFFENTARHHSQFMDRDDNPVELDRFPEMQMPWVDAARIEYYKVHDELVVKQLHHILKPDGTALEGCREKACDLIKDLHDTALVAKYSVPINKECLDLFYESLTPILTKGSKAMEYFRQCSGKVDVVLPQGVKCLGADCFCDCSSLRSMILPDSITSLGNCCFYHCTSLQEINLPNSITSLGSLCFYQCSSLQEITLPDSAPWFGACCFSNCKQLQEVTVPDGVTYLGETCFAFCSRLQKISLPNSVTSLGQRCFMGCPLTDVYYSGSQEDRKYLVTQSGNDAILNATWHYNCKG